MDSAEQSSEGCSGVSDAETKSRIEEISASYRDVTDQLSDLDSIERNDRKVLYSIASNDSSFRAFRNEDRIDCHWCAQHGRPLTILARNRAQHFCSHFSGHLAVLKKMSLLHPSSIYPNLYERTKKAIIAGEITSAMKELGLQPLRLKGDNATVKKAKEIKRLQQHLGEKKLKTEHGSSRIFCSSSDSSTYASGSNLSGRSRITANHLAASAASSASGSSTSVCSEDLDKIRKTICEEDRNHRRKEVAKKLCALKADKSSDADEVNAMELALRFHDNVKGLAHHMIQSQKGNGQTLVMMKARQRMLKARFLRSR